MIEREAVFGIGFELKPLEQQGILLGQVNRFDGIIEYAERAISNFGVEEFYDVISWGDYDTEHTAAIVLKGQYSITESTLNDLEVLANYLENMNVHVVEQFGVVGGLKEW